MLELDLVKINNRDEALYIRLSKDINSLLGISREKNKIILDLDENNELSIKIVKKEASINE